MMGRKLLLYKMNPLQLHNCAIKKFEYQIKETMIRPTISE